MTAKQSARRKRKDSERSSHMADQLKLSTIESDAQVLTKMEKEQNDFNEIEAFAYGMYPDFDKYSNQKKRLLLDEIQESEKDAIERALRMRLPNYEDYSDEAKSLVLKEIEERKQNLKQRCHNWYRLSPSWRDMLIAGKAAPELSDLWTAEELPEKLSEIARREKEREKKSVTKFETLPSSKSGRGRGRPAKDPVTIKVQEFLHDDPVYNKHFNDLLDACKDHKARRILGADLCRDIYGEVYSPNRLRQVQAFIRGRTKSRDNRKKKNT